MSQVLSGHVGTLDLLDLKAISEFYGRDFLPYPFMFTKPTCFATGQEADAYTTTVPDRLHHGDLNVFMDCVTSYADADIRVECHVQHIPNDTPSVRVMAFRTGQLGYFTAQRPDADLIDIYTVSPYDLSVAVCDAILFTQPGKHAQIVIPAYSPRNQPRFDAGLVVRDGLSSSEQITVSASEVTAYATVQSHWRPTRDWGFDRGKPAVLWVRVNGDGEYIYEADQSYAKPMTRENLRGRIDQLITDDIAILKDFRRV